jgi:electron transfer flavoprotein alpha subunit
MKPILVIAEIFDGHIRQVTWELAAAAWKIAIDQTQKRICPAIHIIVPAEDPVPLSEKISTQTGMDVIGLQIPELKVYTSDVYIYCLGQLIRKINPSHILAAHTSQGRDFTPGLAIDLNAASISGVTDIRFDEDGLIYSRPVFDNTQNMIIRPATDRPVVLTLMPGVFKPDSRAPGKPGRLDIHKILFRPESYDKGRIQHQKILKRPCENQALKEAKVIVAAGRGVGEKQNLESVFNFAKCFPFSAVGASRPLVDMGWIGYEHQVGITGAMVAPKLYIACGISGSSQHLAGMKDAELVISINKNPAAPIFRHSDLCITEDVLEFIQAFLTKAGAVDET